MSNALCPRLMAAAVVVCGAVLSAPAAATSVTLTHSQLLHTLVQGSSTSLVFDLNSFLSNQGYRPGDVLGGSVSVFGFSDALYGVPQVGANHNISTVQTASRVVSYSYEVPPAISCSYPAGCYVHGGYTAYWSDVFTDYNQFSDRDVRHTDAVADQMRVSTGSTVSTSTVSALPASVGEFGTYRPDGVSSGDCTSNGCNTTTLYSRERDIRSALAGALGITQALDINALLGLRDNGAINIDFAAPVGQYWLNQVSFDLTLREPMASVAMASNHAQAAPEPASLPLAGLALGLAMTVGGLSRRARRRSQA